MTHLGNLSKKQLVEFIEELTEEVDQLKSINAKQDKTIKRLTKDVYEVSTKSTERIEAQEELLNTQRETLSKQYDDLKRQEVAIANQQNSLDVLREKVHTSEAQQEGMLMAIRAMVGRHEL